MIAYRYASTFVREDFDRDNVANQGDTLPKFYLSATRETNTTGKSHRQRQPRHPGLNLKTARLSPVPCESNADLDKHGRSTDGEKGR